MISEIIKFIQEHTNTHVLDVDKCDEKEYWLIFEFNCDKCSWWNDDDDYCVNYSDDVSLWCDAMEKINIGVEKVADLIRENFDVEDAYESSEICNGMYVIL